MQVSAIVAMSKNRVIGRENQLPWRLPEDLKRFKKITMNHPIIMGRKTFESIGRVLPGRANIIISRNSHFQAPGAKVVGSLEDALSLCKNEKEVFIIGGAEIYKLAMSRIQRIYLTLVHQEIQGDAFFPAIDPGCFKETSREDFQEPFSHSYLVLDRTR
jgi:dihydrofolate reductase